MKIKNLSSGIAHKVPADLRTAILADANVLAAWESLTPLARNEWICWVESVKKPETRREHVQRVCSQLKEGKRRPCCWPGCVHRTDKALNSSQRWIQKRKLKKTYVSPS